jgi:NADH-quinone oxidoreductase subunit E
VTTPVGPARKSGAVPAKPAAPAAPGATPKKTAGAPTPQKRPTAASGSPAQVATGGPPRTPHQPAPPKTAAPVAVEFPPEAIREACERIVARYPTRVAALLPVLHLAQAHFDGWVSPEVEAGVARYLGVGDGHVRGVLTFYSMFNTAPVGRHVVWVCRTLTCWLRGAADLTKAAMAKAGIERVGGSSADGRFHVREMECLGLCEVAPAVFVDGKPHGDVTPERLERLMDACSD